MTTPFRCPSADNVQDKTQDPPKPQIAEQTKKESTRETQSRQSQPVASEPERARADSADSLKSDTTVTMNVDVTPHQSDRVGLDVISVPAADIGSNRTRSQFLQHRSKPSYLLVKTGRLHQERRQDLILVH
jgi:hypothetical protein